MFLGIAEAELQTSFVLEDQTCKRIIPRKKKRKKTKNKTSNILLAMICNFPSSSSTSTTSETRLQT
jgi:hypothetical protein